MIMKLIGSMVCIKENPKSAAKVKKAFLIIKFMKGLLFVYSYPSEV